MDHPLIDLINAKIAAADADGEFDNLPGAGKPLPKEDDAVNALLNRVMRENGAVPEFVTLSRQLELLRAELRATGDRSKRRQILKNMSLMDVKIDLAKKAAR